MRRSTSTAATSDMRSLLNGWVEAADNVDVDAAFGGEVDNVDEGTQVQ